MSDDLVSNRVFHFVRQDGLLKLVPGALVQPLPTPPKPAEPPKPARRERKGRTSQRFLSSAAWRTARAECFDRLGKACDECKSTDRINVDHILPRRTHPHLALDQRNLRPLCWPCNRAKNFRVMAELAARFGLELAP